MIVIPAIDLSQGQVVRLERGDMSRRTVYSDDPAQTALRWQAEGAQRLHVVDLDGALEGRPVNLASVQQIVEAVDISVDLGGGLRTLEEIARAVQLGVRWILLGTSAVKEPGMVLDALARFGDAISVSIDARDGIVAVEGWRQTSEVEAIEVAREMAGMGVHEVVYTDIARDGMLTGPNVEATRMLAMNLDTPIIAAGGVKSLDDIRALKELEPLGVVGAITGRAIYTGDLDLREALDVAAGRA
jgi:phosphoribosylformimino-5-aminoimidazole carboxamide ribotide isomerase